MTHIPMTFSRYFFVFITIIDRVNNTILIIFYVLREPLAARDVYYIMLRPLNILTDFFDICNKQMLIYIYIIFGQLSVKDCVNYKQCLHSLRTALVFMLVWNADAHYFYTNYSYKVKVLNLFLNLQTIGLC